MNPTTRTYKTSIELDVAVRGEMVGILNQHLADSLDLYSQAKQAHWNVKGMNFYQLHLLFDEVADKIEDMVDMVAERVTALGAHAEGTVRMSAANSTLPEFPDEINGGEAYLNAVIERVAQYANASRANATRALESGDEATGDLFIEITRESDKLLYFLEAHVQ